LNTLVKTTNEAIRLELWRRGNISFYLRPAQRKIDAGYRQVGRKLFVANCSRRFRKSWWAANVALSLCLQKPGQAVIYATALDKDVEEIILPAFKFYLADCPEDLKPKYNGQKKRFEFANGSTIKLCGVESNPDSIRGRFCDLMILDEAGHIDKLDYIYSSVIMPMLKGRQDARVIMISTPSISPAHPFQGFCQKAELEGSYLKLTIYDDPETTQEEADELHHECLTETDWLREYMCEFVVDETLAVIPEFDDKYIGEYVPNEFRVYYHNYVGLDIGVRDKTAALFAHYDFLTAKVYIHDEWEISGPQTTTQKIYDEIKGKETELWDDGKVYLRVGDNSHLLLLNDLTLLHSMPFAATDKAELHSMVNKVRMWVKTGRIIVNPKCKMLIGCLKNAIWKENRKEMERSLAFGHFDHVAALIYLIRNINEYDNPIPRNYGYNSDHQLDIMHETKNLSSNAIVMEKAFSGGGLHARNQFKRP
jgi:hypothetical protein